MRRHVVHELRLGSFADGQAVEPPDTALVGRFSTGQEHPDAGADRDRPATVDHPALRRFLAENGRP
ncbi:MAG TPA: hypothetical protein VFW14_19180 [Gaiellales bacterium]|nr:hypothetical protein [Gaiellales bacterium]